MSPSVRWRAQGVTASNTVSIGTLANAAYDNAVALGAGSQTQATLANLTANAAYVPAGAAASSIQGTSPVGEGFWSAARATKDASPTWRRVPVARTP
jgi:hypothetical protein